MKMKLMMRLINEAGKGIRGVLINAQTYSIEQKKWTTFAENKTDTKGNLVIGDLDANDIFGPPNSAVRLVTQGRNQVALWSSSPVIGVKGRELIFDFGQIVDLRKSKIKVAPLTVVTERGLFQAGVDRIAITTLKASAGDRDSGISPTGPISAVSENDVKFIEQVNIVAESRTAEIKAREMAAISERTIALGERDIAIAAKDAARAEADNLLSVKSNLEQELRKLRTTSDQKETQLSRLQQEKSNLELSKQSIESQLEILKNQTSEKDETLRVLKAERDELFIKAAATETKLNEETAAKVELSNSVKSKTAISDVFGNIGKEVATANDKLDVDKNPYRISGLKVAVKGALVDNGQSVLLNDLNSQAGTVATVEANLNPQTVLSTLEQVTIPNVIGLTSGAAGRVLESVGLAPNIAMTMLEKGQTPGQVTQQSPKAGQKVDRGSKVLLAIPKRPSLTDT